MSWVWIDWLFTYFIGEVCRQFSNEGKWGSSGNQTAIEQSSGEWAGGSLTGTKAGSLKVTSRRYTLEIHLIFVSAWLVTASKTKSAFTPTGFSIFELNISLFSLLVQLVLSGVNTVLHSDGPKWLQRPPKRGGLHLNLLANSVHQVQSWWENVLNWNRIKSYESHDKHSNLWII